MFGSWLKWVVGRRGSPVLGSDEVIARSAWVTVMGLVEISVGHHTVGWFFWVSDGFIYLFIIIIIFFNIGFCSGGILVNSGQWCLGFFWVFVLMGFCSAGFFWVDHRRFLGIFDGWVFLG